MALQIPGASLHSSLTHVARYRSVYWYFNRVNPSGLGAVVGALPRGAVLTNFLVMVTGEWLVTDSIIAYLSHHFTSRYDNNIPEVRRRVYRPARNGAFLTPRSFQCWEFLRVKKNFFAGLFLIAIWMPTLVLTSIDYAMCLTSRLETESDWVLGRCPEPPTNRTEMARAFT